MPGPIHPDVVAKFDKLIKRPGMTITLAARECGVSRNWASERAKGRRKRDQAKFYANNKEDSLPPPRPAERLSVEAKRALEDFAYFRLRFFGRHSVAWQVDAANRQVELLATDRKEFVVINVPPGAGKTTLQHDICCWAIARNRAVRILLGSLTERQAKMSSGRIMDSLERERPYLATEQEKLAGAQDAAATLMGDYGRFKPTTPKVWRREEFTVAQPNDMAASDKESTVTAYGKDGGVLGGRYDYVLWDDLVDNRNQRTADAREELGTWWASTAETRVEPGGLLVLNGQRMGSDDLYRHALDMRDIVLDDDGLEVEGVTPPAKYTHIIYRAHYEELCTGLHPKGTPAWPEGCLLDPYRLSWRDLASKRKNSLDSYLVQYQQEDTDPETVLVQKLWLTGGRGDDGVVYPGCWDEDRATWELPAGLAGEVFVYATADPSPTKFWSVQLWAYHPVSEQRFLLELIRGKLRAPDLLDWDEGGRRFTGIMQEWQERSTDLGFPIRFWIVEQNAAQRFLLQYDHVQRWLRKQAGVQLVAHDTHRNKSDAQYGVQSLGPLYRSGRIRLPGSNRGSSRTASLKLTAEVTTWPQGSTDDCVMAQWFGEWSLPRLYVPPQLGNVVRLRPSWAHGRGKSA